MSKKNEDMFTKKVAEQEESKDPPQNVPWWSSSSEYEEEKEEIKAVADPPGHAPWSVSNKFGARNEDKNNTAEVLDIKNEIDIENPRASGDGNVLSASNDVDNSPTSRNQVKNPAVPEESSSPRTAETVFPGAFRMAGLNHVEGYEDNDEYTIEVGYGEEDGTTEPSPPSLSAELVDLEVEERLRQEQIKEAVKKELQKAVVGEVVPEAISNRGRKWKLVGAVLILVLILIVVAVVLGTMLRRGGNQHPNSAKTSVPTSAQTSAPTQAPMTAAPSNGGNGGDGGGGGGGGENDIVYGLQPSCNSEVSETYNMCLDLVSMSGSYESWMEAFANAKLKWERIVVGDLPSFSSSNLVYDPQLRCTDYPSTIDGIYLCGREEIIDGPGGVLGSAAPLFTRDSGIDNPRTGVEYSVTLTGYVEFDSDDIADLQSNGEFDEIVFHEMAHVLGAGTLWVENGLYIEGSGIYTSETHADDEWKALGCSGPLPVELDGGEGTAGSHWDEECLIHEIMSGSLTGSAQPVSRITVGALEDIGYSVDYSQADPFTIADLAVCGSFCPEAARRGLRQRERKLKAKLDKAGEDAVMRFAKTKLTKMRKEFEITASLRGDRDDGIKAVEELHVLYKDAGGRIHGVHATWNEVKDLYI